MMADERLREEQRAVAEVRALGDGDNGRSGRGDRLPPVRQRERVLRIVREHGCAIDAAEVAHRLRLHVSTVRFHLDALCAEGLVERSRLPRSGVGRPRTGYQAAEPLDYSVLAEVLAQGLGKSADARARRAERAGREWVRRILPTIDGPPRDSAEPEANLDRGARMAVDVFNRLGFAPMLGDSPAPQTERIIRLTACPVRNLARSHPETVCSVHLGLLQGLLDAATVSARLEPFVERDVCLARLVLVGSRHRT